MRKSKTRNLPPARPSPDPWQVEFERGLTLHRQGKLAEAESVFEDVRQRQPNHFDALHLLAIIAMQTGQLERGIELIQSAIGINANVASAHNNLGYALINLQRYDEAIVSLNRAIALDRSQVGAYHNLGNSLQALGRFDEAVASYDTAIGLKPDQAKVYNSRGNALQMLKRFDDALASYDRALAMRPNYAEALNNRGYTLQELKRYDEALASYDRALALHPDFAEALYNRGITLRSLQRFDEALTSYDRAIAARPDYVEALSNRGNISASLGRNADAFAAYDRAFRLKPDHNRLAGRRLHAKLQLCDWTNFDAEVSHLLSAIREQKLASVPFEILSIPSSPSDQLQCARRDASVQPRFRPIWNGELYSHDRIRVGYLSGDFREHPTGYLAAGLFEHHNKSRFEVTGICFGPDQNSTTRHRIKGAFEHFIEVHDKSDQAIADLVRQLEIEIAVDLMGYTQNSRPGIFARRCAPIQVSYLGYLGTMGTDFIDYVIADKIALPFDQQRFYVENIVHLPDCFLVNDNRLIIAPHTPSRRDVGLPAEGFVFCSFNNGYKLGPPIFELWMRLLQGVEGSVLWLFQSNAEMAVNLQREARRCGIDPSRIIFAPRVTLSEHLARQRLADLFLDTTPYNAGATGAGALWSGVPMLTMIGETFVGRMAASMLHAVGLPELVAKSLPDYEALALKIATEPAFCTALKDKLTRSRGTYPLFDTERFTRHIEAAYLGMWQRYTSGEKPHSFAVAPSS